MPMGMSTAGFVDTNYSMDIQTQSAGLKGLRVRGVAGQTGNLQEWSAEPGTVLARVDANGNLYAPSLISPASPFVAKAVGVITNTGAIIGGSGISSVNIPTPGKFELTWTTPFSGPYAVLA